ncbi:hypothetical protein LIER_03351 [Lithospermum erythrorhizon]|uniref:Uncharacterized protein n=1 Tax=Lithospermum erythrorhizon TaxID=34254 RepID=A0AAV3NST4_LITER
MTRSLPKPTGHYLWDPEKRPRNDKRVMGPREETMEYALRFSFIATNNEAEYKAMILGLSNQPKEQSTLSPKWEGPYRVNRVAGPSTYELEDLDGKSVSRTWHASKLCKYYV